MVPLGSISSFVAFFSKLVSLFCVNKCYVPTGRERQTSLLRFSRPLGGCVTQPFEAVGLACVGARHFWWLPDQDLTWRSGALVAW